MKKESEWKKEEVNFFLLAAFGHHKHDTFYSNSKAEIVVNESDIDDVFESVYSNITLSIQISLGKGSGWIILSVIDHNNNISKYNSLVGSNFI